MNKILESQIVTNKWHEFLYGYDTDDRTKFLKDMEKHYPIVYGEDAPMGIYLEPYGFHEYKEERKLTDQDKLMLDIAAREYLKNLIAYHIISHIESNSVAYHIISHIESNSVVMGEVEQQIIKFLNIICYGREELLSSVKNYLNELKEILNICRENYNSILHSGNAHSQMFEYPDFFSIEEFGEGIKNILNNNGQFNIIIDYKANISLESAKAIMSIVNSRCAGTICMKIATDPEKWPIYVDLNNRFAEFIHDYSCVELDDSNKKSLEKVKSRFEID